MATGIAGADRRLIDPDDLICPGWSRPVRPEPPRPWRGEDGSPAPGWSHLDGSALCWQLSGALAEPVVRCRRGVLGRTESSQPVRETP
jgi:hypothetical protein